MDVGIAVGMGGDSVAVGLGVEVGMADGGVGGGALG